MEKRPFVASKAKKENSELGGVSGRLRGGGDREAARAVVEADAVRVRERELAEDLSLLVFSRGRDCTEKKKEKEKKVFPLFQ